MSSIEIYSKDNCGFCDRARALLEQLSLTFTEYKLDRDFTRDEIKSKFPEARTYPVVVLDSKWIGGYTELSQMIGETAK